jgi:hypothetical protein
MYRICRKAYNIDTLEVAFRLGVSFSFISFCEDRQNDTLIPTHTHTKVSKFTQKVLAKKDVTYKKNLFYNLIFDFLPVSNPLGIVKLVEIDTSVQP